MAIHVCLSPFFAVLSMPTISKLVPCSAVLDNNQQLIHILHIQNWIHACWLDVLYMYLLLLMTTCLRSAWE